MGTHSWAETCPHCGYEGMDIWTSTYDRFIEKMCNACGYHLYPSEDIPNKEDIEMVRNAVAEMPSDKLSKLIVELTDNGAILLDYLKEKYSKGD